MPVLIDAVPENLHKLLQNRRLATIALLRELRAVVVMAVDVAFVLVVGVLGAEDGGADGAGEVFDVVFAVESCDI